MTNKEKLKRIIEQDINPKNYYNEIINKIEKGDKMKNKKYTWKYSLVPICLIVVIVGILFLNHQNNNKTNLILNINEINKEIDMFKLDVDVKVATNNTNFILPFKNEITIPKDLDKESRYIVYFKEDKESKDYNILGNYEIIYSNDSDRSISVKYSKEYKPARDYYFDEKGSKITTINDIELKIYKFKDIYFTEFKYNDYNFDIETSNITEQELSSLLLSILK